MSKILEKPTIECFASYLKSCSKVILLSGAGISTTAGIPDFRSPKTGLYANLQKYSLPYPEAIFELDFFLETPEPFYTLTRELFPGKFRPTKSHLFIKLLQNEGLLLRNYTQNIDMLERLAGLDEEFLVEAHGSFKSARCVGKSVFVPSLVDDDGDRVIVKGCGKMVAIEEFKNSVFKGVNPSCDCGGLIKPDIVFFGESLPERFHEMTQVDFLDCDALIIMGTSLKVMPFAGLVSRVKPSTPRLLINLEVSNDAGFEFENGRDVFYEGTTDDGVELLAKLMGLSEQFEKLVIDQDKDLADGDKVISNVNDIVDRVNGSAVESNGNDKDAVTHLYVKVVDVDDVKIKSADKSQDSKQDVNSTEEDDQDLVASFSKTKI